MSEFVRAYHEYVSEKFWMYLNSRISVHKTILYLRSDSSHRILINTINWIKIQSFWFERLYSGWKIHEHSIAFWPSLCSNDKWWWIILPHQQVKSSGLVFFRSRIFQNKFVTILHSRISTWNCTPMKLSMKLVY